MSALQIILSALGSVERFAAHEIELLDVLLERHRRHHCGPRPWLMVNGVAVELIPGKEVRMSTKITVGHTLTESIAFLDTNGNPMLVPPVLDSPPSWSDSNPAAETLTVSADGLTFSGPAVSPGTDVVSVTVVVGGTSFSATSTIEVDAAPQVLGSVEIVDTVT